MAGVTGLEPAASGVTGRRSNQLSYTPNRACVRVLTRILPAATLKMRLATCKLQKNAEPIGVAITAHAIMRGRSA